MFHSDLDIEPVTTYYALSYVWGSPQQRLPIMINECEVLVGYSLATALRHIRKAHEAVVLWADAVCINQNDIKERNHQVGLMGSVYSKADGVIAWLGEPGEDSDIAFDCIENLASFLDYVTTGSEAKKINRALVEQAMKKVPEVFKPSTRLALDRLSVRPYWTRVWIVQEVTLAKQIQAYCGMRQVNMLQIKNAMISLTMINSVIEMGECPAELSTQGSLAILGLPMFNMLLRIHEDGGNSIDLASRHRLPLGLVSSMAPLDATDPRDKIFGTLGLIAQTTEHYDLISADYEKSLEQVYRNYARYSILTERSLDVMVLAAKNRQSSESDVGLPSWVPDWREKSVGTGLALHKEASSDTYDGFLDTVKISPDDTALIIKGLEVDTISKIYPFGLFPFWRFKEEYGGKSDYESFLSDIMSPMAIKNGETALSMYFRLVSLDRRRGEDKKVSVDREAYFEAAALFLKYIFIEMKKQQVFPEGSPLAQNIDYMPFALCWSFLGLGASKEDRQKLVDLILNTDVDAAGWYEPAVSLRTESFIPFMTRNGKMGLGPRILDAGDRLCQLATHELPFALEPHEDHYLNKGECFVLDLDLPEISQDLIPHMTDFEIR